MARHQLVHLVPSTDLLPDEPYRLVCGPTNLYSVAIAHGTTITPDLAQFISDVEQHNRDNQPPGDDDSGPSGLSIPVQRSRTTIANFSVAAPLRTFRLRDAVLDSGWLRSGGGRPPPRSGLA
ncbi:hypothetical protein [Actinocrispum wychmicini]|uniref:Uncharacterized protein n=1 Tax=Actinocrispum wychmicini TaxID=1213861 RepID=A0A4R2IPS4_9PSEU|nr:hypothetical protein [Actinocrispum wychmicini]TCO47331.1 hypothetical protein EV192_11771 [Actinocrispum wychmicini]